MDVADGQLRQVAHRQRAGAPGLLPLLQQRLKLTLELIGLGDRAPAQVGMIGVAGEQLGEVGASAPVAGPCRQLVGQRLVVGEAEPPGPLRGTLVELERPGGVAALPGQLRFQHQNLRLHVRGALALPALQQLQVGAHRSGGAGPAAGLRHRRCGAPALR